MANNCYLLECTASGERLLVDAADEAEGLLAWLKAQPGTGLASVLTTHQHWDHHRALAAVVEATGASTYAGAADADAITEATGVPIATTLEHGDTVTVGEVVLEVIALRGHTPGSIALLHTPQSGPPQLWTGDSLFPGGVGNTFGDAEAFTQLYDDVVARVFDRLPDETGFFPGHGDPSTLGAERPHLAEWRDRGW
ncbi:MBL fold metallo-hydrolase [Nocardioides sp. Kera G14]|uniref:MBL fold metallo-hydrolase n=1 Tax=Nocardioides sp. Kera G14 TaxID=2884264 RepID=UPI001D124481|nr:MBL fold metallo-hydrolase [Nocardioides sp. Kera G14]UDY25099.1 MBL fold metallo-hydrolase [Nocardioides sp. Kera G14]